jgi:hypothetical protein
MKFIESNTHLSTIIAALSPSLRGNHQSWRVFHAGTLPALAYPALLLHSVILFM